MVLRDVYWRADVYGRLSLQPGGLLQDLYKLRQREAISYLVSVQTNRVFGVPADKGNPEFGKQIEYVMTKYPQYILYGWIFQLPPEIGNDNLYYDHGYSLYTLSEAYLSLKDENLLAPIKNAADWAVEQAPSANINYTSALAKGLAAAYLANGNIVYRDRALVLHLDYILPNQKSNGEWSDSHNQRLEYHGFIGSGLIAVRRILSLEHPNYVSIETSLQKALSIMAERNLNEGSTYESTWMGTNIMAWTELSMLRALSESESRALIKCIKLVNENTSTLLALSGFAYRKGLYSNFVIGSATAAAGF